ncbi:MAG: hypothetical protein ACXACY_28350 [Candidatus Hodarchaeales archaeon]
MIRLIFFITLFLIIGISNYGLCEIYKWTNDDGSIGLSDDISKVPEKYRNQLKTKKKPRLKHSERESTTEYQQENVKEFNTEQFLSEALAPGSPLDNHLKNKWRLMTDSLKKGDHDEALALIHPDKRNTYSQMFEVLGSQLPFIVSTEVELQPRELRAQYYALYELVTIENGTKYSYEVVFVRDSDGTWWIYEY